MSPRFQIIAALWFFQLANYLDRIAISFAGPSIMRSLSIEPGSFGIVLASFAVGYGLAQIPGGLLADRWGAKLLIVIAPLFWALFTGVTGLVAGVVGFAIVRACFGVSEGIANPACYKIIGDNFNSQERARASGIWATSLAIGPAIAAPIAGGLLLAFGWRMLFVLLAAPAIVAALVNYLFVPADKPVLGAPLATDHEGHESFREVIGRPSLWLISLAFLTFSIGFWGYLGWMPSYLALEHHLDVKALGLLGGIPYLFAFCGLLALGWLGSTALYRFRPQLVACSYLLAGLSLYLAYTAGTLTSSLIGLSSAAFFLYGGFGPFGAILLDLAPEKSRAAFSAVVNTAGQIGGVVAPIIVGLLVSATHSFASGFAFMIAALCISAICYSALIPLIRVKPLFPRVIGEPGD